MNYEYDKYNRLALIKNNNNQQLISRYEYKLVPHPIFTYYFPVEKEYSMRYPIAFKVKVEGGSGSFNYEWQIKDVQGKLLIKDDISNSNTIAYKFEEKGIVSIICKITDNISKKSMEVIQKTDIIIPPLEVRQHEAIKWLLEQQYMASCNINGGSGYFSYTWFLDEGYGEKQIGNGNDLAITFSKPGKVNLICQVKDLKTGLTAKENKEIIAVPMFIQIASINPYLNTSPQTQTYIRGGSNKYSYSWYLKDVVTGQVYIQQVNSTSNTFSPLLSKLGWMEILCVVKDLVTGYTETETYKFKVLLPPIEFTNIKREQQSQNAKITAVIRSAETATVSFRVTFSSSGTSINYAEFKIGNYSYKTAPGANGDNKIITIDLAKGETSCSVTLNKTIANSSCNAALIMEQVTTGNNTIGENRVLNTAIY